MGTIKVPTHRFWQQLYILRHTYMSIHSNIFIEGLTGSEAMSWLW